MLSSLSTKSNKFTKVKIPTSKHIRISNNMTALNVVSTLTQLEVDRNALENMTLGTNVQSLQPSCFAECANLKSVVARKNTNTVGDYAFYGCRNLTSFTPLDQSTQYDLQYIGDYAFYGAGFKELHCNVNTTYSMPIGIGEFAFAENRNLESIQHDSPFGYYEFQNCTSLKNVAYSSNVNSLQVGTFKGCTSLKDFTVLKDINEIYDECFSGCTALTSVAFENGIDLVHIGNNAFYNTSIASFHVPASITSFTQLADNAFAGMPNLRDIYLDGMTYDMVADKRIISSQISLGSGKIYSNTPFEYLYKAGFGDKYKSKSIAEAMHKAYFEDKTSKWIYDAALEAKMNNKPFLYTICNYMVYMCGPCGKFVERLSDNNYDLLKRLCNMNCLIFENNTFCPDDEKTKKEHRDAWNSFVQRNDGYDAYSDSHHNIFGRYRASGGFVQVYMYKPGKSQYVDDMYVQGKNYSIENTILPFFKDLTQKIQVVFDIKYDKFRNKFFGLNHDVTVHTKDGNTMYYINAQGSSSLFYTPPIYVDNITVNDFKYDQWYGNAEQLKQFADQNNVPVFAVATLPNNSDAASKAFDQQVFSNPEFQQKLVDANMLLCKVESQGFSFGQAGFLYNDWMQDAQTKKLPLMMLYYNNLSGGIDIESGKTFADITTDFAYFSLTDDPDAVDGCPSLTSFDDVMKWLDNAISPYTAQHRQDLEKPQIEFYTEEYPYWKRYANQLNDTYGRYYPVKRLMAPAQTSYTVNINGNSFELNPASKTIVPNILQQGTYQYFPTHDQVYDKSGFIFQIGPATGKTIAKQESFNYGEKTIEDYISNMDVTSMMSTFLGRIYLDDDNEHPTTNIDPNAFPPGQPTYNITASYAIDNTAIASKSISQANMWLSCQPSVIVEIEEDGDEIYDIIPTGDVYVISSQLFTSDGQPVGLQWLSAFEN